jgi:hypothetical protein
MLLGYSVLDPSESLKVTAPALSDALAQLREELQA